MGVYVYGKHEDVMAAAEIANQRGRELARKKRTCYTPAKIAECKKGEDGLYTCRANVAKHPGSCGKSVNLSDDLSVGDFLDNPEEGAQEEAPE